MSIGTVASDMAASVKTRSAAAPGSRVQKLSEYLRALSERDRVPIAVVEQAWEAWSALATTDAVPVPDAAPGPDGQLLFTWDREAHHLELEFSPGATPSFFYRNRQTAEVWEDEWRPGESIPTQVRTRLAHFYDR